MATLTVDLGIRMTFACFLVERYDRSISTDEIFSLQLVRLLDIAT